MYALEVWQEACETETGTAGFIGETENRHSP